MASTTFDKLFAYGQFSQELLMWRLVKVRVLPKEQTYLPSSPG